MNKLTVFVVITVFLFMFSAKVVAQKEASFRQSFDSPPIRKKNIVEIASEVKEGYIVKRGSEKALEVKLTIQAKKIIILLILSTQ